MLPASPRWKHGETRRNTEKHRERKKERNQERNQETGDVVWVVDDRLVEYFQTSPPKEEAEKNLKLVIWSRDRGVEGEIEGSDPCRHLWSRRGKLWERARRAARPAARPDGSTPVQGDLRGPTAQVGHGGAVAVPCCQIKQWRWSFIIGVFPAVVKQNKKMTRR